MLDEVRARSERGGRGKGSWQAEDVGRAAGRSHGTGWLRPPRRCRFVKRGPGARKSSGRGRTDAALSPSPHPLLPVRLQFSSVSLTLPACLACVRLPALPAVLCLVADRVLALSFPRLAAPTTHPHHHPTSPSPQQCSTELATTAAWVRAPDLSGRLASLAGPEGLWGWLGRQAAAGAGAGAGGRSSSVANQRPSLSPSPPLCP